MATGALHVARRADLAGALTGSRLEQPGVARFTPHLVGGGVECGKRASGAGVAVPSAGTAVLPLEARHAVLVLVVPRHLDAVVDEKGPGWTCRAR